MEEKDGKITLGVNDIRMLREVLKIQLEDNELVIKKNLDVLKEEYGKEVKILLNGDIPDVENDLIQSTGALITSTELLQSLDPFLDMLWQAYRTSIAIQREQIMSRIDKEDDKLNIN